MVEGFADYVGYLNAGVPVQTAAHELRDEVVAGKVPRTLPADDEFSGADPRLAQVYEEAWLACRVIAERWGQDTLVAVYRRLGTATATSDVALDSVFRDLLHVTPAQFDAIWSQRVKAELS
jgi:hypothetical protein